MKRRAIFLFIFLFSLCRLGAQPPVAFVWIDDITVTGNKKTQTSLILRELFIKAGDSILLPELAAKLEINRLQLMNTGLFVDADLHISNWVPEESCLQIQVQVVEAWYIYPLPIFELADRNFNTWWNDYGHSLRRVDYGLYFYHNNLSGRRDVLKGVVQFGFTNRYELQYQRPFFDKKQQWGLALGAAFSRNKEINFTTEENRQRFFRQPGEHLLQQFMAKTSATYRRRLQAWHTMEASYRNNAIAPQVRDDLNPDYFLGALRQRYASLAYEFTADTRDIRPYPMRGIFLRARLQKDGLLASDDLNALNASVLFKYYRPFNRRWSMGLTVAGRAAMLRHKQPFASSQALGYGSNYIRGYEYYVIDGLDYAYEKASLRFMVFDRTFHWGRWMPFPATRKMPHRLYLVAYNDMGVANNPYYAGGNDMANSLLWGYGLSLDWVVYYNKVFRVEFSRNRLGENGVFLHWDTSF
jgi:outer membrane protein assembly factor BamA